LFGGVADLPDEYKTVVTDTLETGEIVQPPKPELAPVRKPKKSKVKEDNDEEPPMQKPKKSRIAKDEVSDDGSEGNAPVPEPRETRVKDEDDDDGNEEEAPEVKPKNRGQGKNKVIDADISHDHKPKSKSKAKPKPKGKKRSSDELDSSSEAEYVPRKTRSRAAPLEEMVNPAVARMGLTDAPRTEAAK
jgi:hypothetical protein